MNPTTGIVLINPPVLRGDIPSLGLALLSAHLKNRGIPVQVLDTCNALMERFCAPERVHRGLEYVAQRIADLNGKGELTFLESNEYWLMLAALRQEERLARLIGPIRRRIEELPALGVASDKASKTRISSLPFFPEGINYDWRYISPYNEFSSRDVIRAARMEGGMLEGLFETLLAGIESSPRIIGISILLPSQMGPAFRCARIARSMFPAAHITVGGATTSVLFRTPVNPALFEIVDSIVMHEGQKPLEALWHELNSPQPQMARVPNLLWLDAGKVRRNPVGPPEPVEGSPIPDFESSIHAYPGLDRATIRIPYQLSRGCKWGKCTFCSTGFPMVQNCQQPSADFLFEQMRCLVRDHGFRKFHFTDEWPDPVVLEALSRRLAAENAQIDFRCQMRFDKQLTLDRCLAYRQAGCRSVSLGLESYSDRILKLMRKGTTVEIANRVLMNLNWSGVPAHTFMMVGFPGETEDEARDSYSKVQEGVRRGLIGGFNYTPFTLLPESDVRVHPEKYGVTDIELPEDQDLNPPTRRFKTPGMTPLRAMQLGLEFNKSPQMETAQKCDAGKIHIDGFTLSVAYNMEELLRYLAPVMSIATSYSEQMTLGQSMVGDFRPSSVQVC